MSYTLTRQMFKVKTGAWVYVVCVGLKIPFVGLRRCSINSRTKVLLPRTRVTAKWEW